MSIETSDVVKVAHLARIQLNDEQIPQLTNSLNTILQLIDAMQQVDTTGIQPMTNAHDAKQYLREDVVSSSNQRELLLQNAPLSENGLFLVPKVID